ncbi:MAG: thioredoxin-disulfide reductase [Candidatus Bathyarchaeota archaeon]|nr:MAG: thioredoxin-disulfide reductase [Candidatus Bathyarchaeota archaeon]
MFDVIILGSGPAGLTAAIYTGRAELHTLLIAGTTWGGQLMLTRDVENFPGFKEGILGPDLMDNMWKQAARFGAQMIYDDVTKVDFSTSPLKVKAGKTEYQAKSIVIATGSSPKWLGVTGEERLRGRGVSVCAVCDAPFFKEKKVMVVGGGDSAMEEALALSKFAREIVVVHRRDELRASKTLQQRVFKDPKIKFRWNSVIREIQGNDRVEGVILQRVDTDEKSKVMCDAVFVAIGHKPNTEIFKTQLDLDDQGYIIAQAGTKTKVQGVFVAGDVADRHYRQAITAAGAGCKAALDVERYLIASP